MIEKTFIDRVPTYPGRVKMTPVPGQANTYDMVRADSPTKEGTPIDKAAFDSIIQSRLTGRFYEMTATKVTLSSASGVNSPIPVSWNNATDTGANSGEYTITASGASGSSHPHRAFDGSTSTYWMSETNKTPWLQLDVPSGIIVKKMKIAFTQRESWSTQTVLQGKTASGAWATLATISLPNSTNLIEYALDNSAAYTSYRLNFTIAAADVITVYEWAISDWNTATYRYDYKISKGVPTTWTKGQRVLVAVPNSSIVGVSSNTLNGISVNTILQPDRRYELVYNGSIFTAKEV